MAEELLPVPRLELRWQQEDEPNHWLCRYRLVLPCRDLRKLGNTDLTLIDMGETRRFADEEPLRQDGTVDTPFLDGVYCRRDMALLHLPGFAIYRDTVTVLKPRARPNQYRGATHVYYYPDMWWA